MKGRFIYGTLGLILTAIGYATLFVFVDNPIVINLLTLPMAVGAVYGCFHAGVALLSVSGIGLVVERL